MSQYKDGTVDVTNASASVTGNNTLWLAEVSVGDLFTVVGSGLNYEVSAITTDTALTLTAPYGGSTDTGVAYVISRDFTPTDNLPIINKGDVETATLLKRIVELIDGRLV